MMRCEHCIESLDAYVDDELPAAERRDVDEHLAACSTCARERDSLARLHLTLSEGLVRYQAPDVLKARIRSLVAQAEPIEPVREQRTLPWWRMAAAGVLIAALSSIATFAVMRAPANSASEEQVLASHVRSLMPGHLTDVVSTDQHNVKPWFNGKVDLSPPVPDLAANGFVLAGGRVDYVGGRAVAVVVYTRRQHVINVYSGPSAGDAPPRAATRNGFHLVRWRHDGLEHWAVSDLNAGELNELVTAYAR